MKPDQQQKLWLQDYLRQVLTYRETYEEVYDHILLALEDRPGQQFFETTINDIVNADFGGMNGLMRLEESCKSNIVKQVRQRYWYYFMMWLKFPRIIFTVPAFLLIYYGIIHKHGILIFILFSTMIITAICLLSIRAFKTGYVFGEKKEALRDTIFRKIAYRPIFVMLLSNLLPFRYIHFGHNNTLAPFVWAACIIALAIHIICFLKLYKDEFAISIIQ